MSELLLHYERPDPATWVYLSSFLMIGLFFVFHRFWSIRNVDICLLILLGPGLLMVYQGRREEFQAAEQLVAWEAAAAAQPVEEPVYPPPAETPAAAQEAADAATAEGAPAAVAAADAGGLLPESWARFQTAARSLQLRGFIWLLAVQLLILLRLLLDCALVRRPLLDPNLTTGGLNFLGISLLVFLMANVVTSSPRMHHEQGPALGPGYPLMNSVPHLFTGTGVPDVTTDDEPVATAPPARASLARILAIAAHLAVVLGMVMIGYRHFSNLRGGVGCATLYLLLPYTAQMTGRVDHVLPAAMLVWAVLCYRRPFLAGIFLGLAAGLVYYPLFLLPLWISFYWQRGVGQFAGGVTATLVALMILLGFAGAAEFDQRLVQMFGLWVPTMEGLKGVWGLGWLPIWRLPVLVGFLLLAGFCSVWPSQKNLGTLISCSASLMVASQFWHGYGGGLYIAWFLPLMLLTIFRPNLEDRVALKVIGSGTGQTAARRREAAIEAA